MNAHPPGTAAWACLLLTAIGLGIAACQSAPNVAGLSPAVDHHVHPRSETAGRDLPRVQQARGVPRSEWSRGRLGAEDVLREMDRNGIGQAVLVSMAYMYGIPELDFPDESGRVRRENDFVIEQAGRAPNRLVAFCSVQPLRDYAPGEVRRCAGYDAVRGIKLHMANSDVDLHDEEEVAALAEIFSRAAEEGLGLLIHLRPRGPGYGEEEIRVFLEELLPHADNTPVQLAHLGGGGMVDLATFRAVRDLAGQVSEHDNLWFDLSAVYLRERDAPSDTGGRAAVRQNRWRVARLIDELGPGRILFGSDWDARAVSDTLGPLRNSPWLTPDQLAEILANRAPYLDPPKPATGSDSRQDAGEPD